MGFPVVKERAHGETLRLFEVTGYAASLTRREPGRCLHSGVSMPSERAATIAAAVAGVSAEVRRFVRDRNA